MKQFFYFASAALFAACASPEMPEVQVDDSAADPVAWVTVPDTSETVTDKTVAAVARRFAADGITRAGEKEIDTVHALRSESGEPLCYIVNYANDSGFIIVSASKDYMPVLAFSDTGSFDMERIDRTGISIWLAEQQVAIEHAAALPDSIRMRYRAMWEVSNASQQPLTFSGETRSYDDVIAMMHNSIIQWQAQGYTVYQLSEYKNSYEFQNLPSSVQEEILWRSSVYANPRYADREQVSYVLISRPTRLEQVGPLLTTTWDQGGTGKYYHWGDYNQKLDAGVRLGCTTVAAGQIMKYHRYPTLYNWDSMADHDPTPTTADFLYALGQAIGIDYQAGTGSGVYESQVVAALRNFGYTNAALYDHTIGNVLAELRSNRPVYMRGNYSTDLSISGHAWVCDGFRNESSSLEIKLMVLEDCPESYEPQRMSEVYAYGPIINYSSTKLHINWGDGIIRTNEYYADNDIVMDNENYAYLRQDIIHIYPVE